MQQPTGGRRGRRAGFIIARLPQVARALQEQAPRRAHGRLEVDLMLGLHELGQLEAALEELVRRRRGQRE